ncbi:lipase 3-like [Contarinia nasturtii]|uniref:lipase 3-like n=1 Tax=Contarinia nasturtii TaxID=265458 RepID=UPI0012D3CC39|nr:lipase 3-like [Contarinia nasturtii]XP_031635029.1 lipase 3-like [Contarinia nasturtii]XP_031635037.1 lipase 3-like [Contarinia nasturtii]
MKRYRCSRIANKMIASIIVILLFIEHFPFISTDQMLKRVQAAGYTIERHYITTDDGYILRLYRIPSSPKTVNNSKHNKPILLMHGLTGSSRDYVVYPNISPGYYFAQHGFDVWLGNARGNTFSRNHTSLDPDEGEFWQFSWHEIAMNDLPAMIDFILYRSNHNQLIYGGHSQGGTTIFALLSERPEYNKKISLVHAIAAAVYLKNAQSFLIPIWTKLRHFRGLAEKTQLYELLGGRTSQYFQPLAILCTSPFSEKLCKSLVGYLYGPLAAGSYYNNLVSDYLSVDPSGSSFLQVIHFGQLFRTGRFEKFDDQQLGNPPQYNISNVQTKVHIIYGTNDYIVPTTGSHKLIRRLSKTLVAVDETDFSHYDFFFGQQAHQLPSLMLRVINAHT